MTGTMVPAMLEEFESIGLQLFSRSIDGDMHLSTRYMDQGCMTHPVTILSYLRLYHT